MSFTRYLDLLRARCRSATGRVALGVARVRAVSRAMAPMYTATARVLVDVAAPEPAPERASSIAVPPANPGETVTSERVALAVVDTLGLVADPQAIERWRRETGGVGSIRHHCAQRLRRQVAVRTASDPRVLSIACCAADPRFAARVANAFAYAYVDLSAQCQREQASHRRGGGSPARIDPDVGCMPGVAVLAPAAEPVQPSSPKPRLGAALAAFVGALTGNDGAPGIGPPPGRIRGPNDLLLASGRPPLATLRDAFIGGPAAGHGRAARANASVGGRHRTPELAAAGAEGDPRRIPIGQILVQAGLIHAPEVERILAWARNEGVRFGEAAVANRLVTQEQVERALARRLDDPESPRPAGSVSEEVVAACDAGNPLVSDLRPLRDEIRSAQALAPPGTPLKTLAVVSAGSGEGKTFLAANLAVTFSQMGQRTLLVDADLRCGRLHTLFGVPNTTGLSSMLNRCIPPGSLHRIPGLGKLILLPRGPEAPNPSELLSREVFDHLLAAFARSFDIVILDTPGGAGQSDAMLIARRAAGALLVARRGVSDVEAVSELVRRGATQRIAVLGSVLNGA